MKLVRIVIFTIGLVLLFVLGCNNPNVVESQNYHNEQVIGDSTADYIELNFWTYPRWKGIKGTESNGKEGDWEKYVIKDFEKTYPNVKINLKTLEYNSGPKKVNIAIATGMQPDILRDYPGRHLDYANRGLLVSLEDYITDEERKQYINGIIENCRGTDGKQYLIPWGITNKFMIVNRDLFRDVGVEYLLPRNEDRTWTYEQFEKALESVNNPEKGIYGCALYAGNEQADNGMVAIMENFGGELIRFTEGKPIAAFNSKEGEAAGNFFRELINRKLAAPCAETLKATDCEKLFAQGKIAVLIHGSAKAAQLVKSLIEKGKVKPFEMYPVMFPNAEGIIPHVFGEFDTYAVFKSGDSEREKMAVKFCKYITGKKYINDIRPSMNFPVYKYASDLYTGDEFMEYAKRTSKFNKDYYNNVKGITQIRAVLYPAMRELFASDKPVEKILNDLEKDVQQILDENYKE